MFKNTIQIYRDRDYLGNEIIVLFCGNLNNDSINDMVVDMAESIYRMDGEYINNSSVIRVSDLQINYMNKDNIIEKCGCCGNPIYEQDIIGESSYMCAYCNSIFEI